MFRQLEKYAPDILGVTRILIGFSLSCHGAQKIFGAFGGVPPEAPAFVVWIAGPIELFGGALMAIGLISRGAAFLMSGLMAFAYFLGHAPQGPWPILNGGELAIAYSWLSLYLSAQGPGAWALDNLRAPRSEASPTLGTV